MFTDTQLDKQPIQFSERISRFAQYKGNPKFLSNTTERRYILRDESKLLEDSKQDAFDFLMKEIKSGKASLYKKMILDFTRLNQVYEIFPTTHFKELYSDNIDMAKALLHLHEVVYAE